MKPIFFDTVHHAQRDENNQTPLSLAAAEGSLDMFNHLFNKLMKIEWVFGPVTCRNLCLLGIDVPLENELKEMHGDQTPEPTISYNPNPRPSTLHVRERVQGHAQQAYV